MVFANAAAAIDPASYTLSSDGKTLTKWLGTETEIDFATDETLMKVEAIGTYAFQDCSAITIINLNPGLTAIERGAFMDCTSLATITLPATLTTIGNAAFSDCRALRSNRLSFIGDHHRDIGILRLRKHHKRDTPQHRCNPDCRWHIQ